MLADGPPDAAMSGPGARPDEVGPGLPVTIAIPSSGRGANSPAVSAMLARTRLRTPIATTNRARWTEVTG